MNKADVVNPYSGSHEETALSIAMERRLGGLMLGHCCRSALAALALAGCLTAGQANASPYTYTLTGDVDGTLGTQTLTDEPFTWTVVADPNAPTTLPGNVPALPATSDTIELSGYGSATVTGPTVAASANNSTGFVSNTSPLGGLTWTAPALANYVLNQAVGPLGVNFQAATPFATTLGLIGISNATNLVFTATGAPPPPPPDTIRYVLSGLFTGSLGAISLIDRPFTWTLTASTTPVTEANGSPALAASSDVLDVSGVGAVTFTQPGFAVFGATQSAFGFLNEPSGDGISWTSGSLASYTLGTAIGPLAVDFGDAAPTIDTSDGTLSLTNASDLSFSGTILPAPEPASLAILLSPLALLCVIRAHRTRR